MTETVPPVQHCPFCGELVGSFWGRSGADGSTWCDGCQAWFRVQLLDGDGRPVARSRGHGIDPDGGPGSSEMGMAERS